MKKVLLFCAMALVISISAIAGINEKLSASTQLFIAERDGKISLDMKVAGPLQPSRAPLLRTRPVERLIAPLFMSIPTALPSSKAWVWKFKSASTVSSPQ